MDCECERSGDQRSVVPAKGRREDRITGSRPHNSNQPCGC
jgi:hypothetical protein